VLVAALAGEPGVGRAEPPPAPPPGHPPLQLEPGQELRVLPQGRAVVPGEGGIYLDPQAFTYQVELRRWMETRDRSCQQLLDEKPPPGLVWLGVALVAGIAAGYAAARATR
jgi:hypothetical protein